MTKTDRLGNIIAKFIIWIIYRLIQDKPLIVLMDGDNITLNLLLPSGKYIIIENAEIMSEQRHKVEQI